MAALGLNEAPQTTDPIVAPAPAKDRRRPGRPDHVSAGLVPLLRAPGTAETPAPASWDEDARLAALQQLDLLDTAPTEAFDRITRIAAQIFSLPIAAVSLTASDRQWFKSRVGVDHSSIPRDKAPCAQVAASSEALVVPDLLLDPCYRDSPLASTGVRFYAGAPLTTREGFCLGSICVLGPEPRQASESEMASLHDLAAMVMAQIELQHAFGRVDPLSGLPNHNQFIEDLEDLAKDRPAHERRFAVLIDVATPEQLSAAMRVMGPAFLDDMIEEAALAIKSAIGPTRTAYHVAPTQFAFLSPPDVEEQSYVALLARTMAEFRASASSRFVTTSVIGVAPFALGQADPRDVLRIANSAVQDAYGTESKVSVYSSTQDTVHRRRFTLLNEFGGALETADQLSLVFQPRIDLAFGTCVGAEALLRWKHPRLGAISPGEFIPIVEQTSMAKAMTAWVLEAALTQLAAWRAAGLDLLLSMNVSASNLREHDLAARVVQGLAKHALAAERLELEITESALMADGGQALAQLETIAGVGIRLAIDDFGTGYSSLSYLQQLPIQVVKIDQSFMRNLVADERKRSLVATMILLSHNLGYRVVAEGVESLQVLDIVEEAACDEAQGYFFGRPMIPADFATWIRNWVDPQPSHSRHRGGTTACAAARC
jgi:EAL domain-containing protein (putative c-di-GMP-specific phosphodiesterase class I)/GGDEF domain-containing protein